MPRFTELSEDSGREEWEVPLAKRLATGEQAFFSLDTLEEGRAILIWNRHFESLSVLTIADLEAAYEEALGTSKKRWFIHRDDGPFVFVLSVAGDRMIRLKMQSIFHNPDVCVKVDWIQ